MLPSNVKVDCIESFVIQVQQWSEETPCEEKVKAPLNDAPVDKIKELLEEDVDIDDDYLGEETEVARCKWGDCCLEFPDMKELVEHINATHIQVRRGAEEYPCFWKGRSYFLASSVM